MKTSNVDILILPGLGGGGPDHWYQRWLSKLRTARRIEQRDWDAPDLDVWRQAATHAVEQADKPVVLVAHSLGVLVAVHAAPHFPHQKVLGAYLVAPPDLERAANLHPELKHFPKTPKGPLPFPSILVASNNDPYCDATTAEDMSYDWGSKFESAGESGHINPDSGQGPWPEGLLSFANFMSGL